MRLSILVRQSSRTTTLSPLLFLYCDKAQKASIWPQKPTGPFIMASPAPCPRGVRQDPIPLEHVPYPCPRADLRTDTELLAEIMGRAAKLCTIHKNKVFLVASLQRNLLALSLSKL